mgnify:CR=1 FL=1
MEKMFSNTSTGDNIGEVRFKEENMSLEDVIDDIHFKLLKIEHVLNALVDGIRKVAGEDQ